MNKFLGNDPHNCFVDICHCRHVDRTCHIDNYNVPSIQVIHNVALKEFFTFEALSHKLCRPKYLQISNLKVLFCREHFQKVVL